MRQRTYAKEFHKLLHSYFACLDMYFSVLLEAYQQTKRPRKDTSLEVLERFIETGKKIQNILQYLQTKDPYT
jgi:hypothetical protein